MVQETLNKIEKRVRDASGAADAKEELLALVGELRSELAALESTHAEEARRIASQTEAATRESTRPPPNSPQASAQTSAEEARAGLSESVRQFEATHPRLGSLVRAICDSLAAMGI